MQQAKDENKEKMQNKKNITSRLPVIDVEEGKKTTASTRTAAKMPFSARAACLCSPTTHAGSFRCRLHRSLNYGQVSGGNNSIGLNISDLDSKSDHPSLQT